MVMFVAHQFLPQAAAPAKLQAVLLDTSAMVQTALHQAALLTPLLLQQTQERVAVAFTALLYQLPALAALVA